MNFSKYIVIIISVSVLLASCNGKENHANSETLTIDIEKHYKGSGEEMLLSDLVNEIDYVKLETNENCFLSVSAWPEFISENYILIRQYSPPRILLFSRKGKYLNDIGVFGNGPGEFINILYPVISPDEKHVLFNDSSKGLLLFKIDGSFVGLIDQGEHRFKDFSFTRDGNIAGFKERINLPQTGGYQVLLYDTSLNITGGLVHSDFDDIPPIMFTWDQMMPNNGILYYQNRLNDTIFKIQDDNTIIPEVVLNLGKFKIPGPNTVQPEIYNYFDVVNFTSTPNYYLITFFNDPIFRQTPRVGRAFFVFDKNRMQGWFLKRHNISSPDGIVESKMPVNNLDGLSEPKVFYSKSLNYDPHRVVCLDKLEISDILEYRDKGLLDSNQLINNSYSKKLQKLLDNSSKEDNPIIRICYLK